MPSGLGTKLPARARAYGSIRGPSVEAVAMLRIEGTVGLQVIELTQCEPGNEHAPDVAQRSLSAS